MKAKHNRARVNTGGFVLVVTISLLVILTVVAVGLLSLSTVSLKSSSLESAHARARANARMALMMAIDRLQSQLGPDQRISANAEILDTNPNTPTPEGIPNPKWLGVWDSWRAGPSSDPTDPSDPYPSDPSDHKTIISSNDDVFDGMHPTYQANRADHFHSWLVSLPNPADAAKINMASTALTGSRTPTRDHRAVTLVDAGTLGQLATDDGASDPDKVNVPLVQIKEDKGNSNITTGRYAWWIGDESQKAAILPDPYVGTLGIDDHIYRSQAAGTMGTQNISGLENATNLEQLDRLLSLKTMDLVSVAPQPGPNDPTASQLNFYHTTPFSYGVLADVREGGLKRDLSTLLERRIQTSEDSEEFMLYDFSSPGRDFRVPIQDLSAYYQLYDDDPDWTRGKRGGINDSPELKVKSPDFGGPSTQDKYLREYTAMYRSPIPIKVQFVLGLGATKITPTERMTINASLASGPNPQQLRATDEYKMLLGIMPVVTLWNPNNVPLDMETTASQILKLSTPPFVLRFRKYRSDGTEFTTNYLNLNYAIGIESTGDGRARLINPYVLQLQFAKSQKITFQPGEVKIFSVPFSDSVLLSEGGGLLVGNESVLQAENTWDPYGLYVASNSAPPSAPDVVKFADAANPHGGYRLVYGDGDWIEVALYPESTSSRASSVSNVSEIYGAGFNFWMSDPDYVGGNTNHFRNYQFISRFGGANQWPNPITDNFNSGLMLNGFPDRTSIDFKGKSNAIAGSSLLEAVTQGEVRGIAMFSLMAGCETSLTAAGGGGAGRRITTRPFLHGSTLTGPRITDNTRPALYDYGWEWQVDILPDVEDAIEDDFHGRGYFGGGYTSEAGTTSVVQQYLPALPPISIASLSSAHLGGYSLAENTSLASPSEPAPFTTSSFNTNFTLRGAPMLDDFRQVTATGQGGLLPSTQQAVGNSYAHPNIPANKAYKTITQYLNTDISENQQVVPYVDHSYLANKALWDEFFFSSITPQRTDLSLQNATSNQTAAEVGQAFLFDDQPLPNRRLLPYTSNTSEDEYSTLALQYNLFSGGYADKIAAHLMVAAPFNVNSTSVEAWKVLFSSLKDKPVAYLASGQSQLSTTPPTGSTGTKVNPGSFGNAEPLAPGSLTTDPNDPPQQWNCARTLSDDEIGELAEAMVKEVKKRGPFLSLSEFVNRRLEGSTNSAMAERSAKGALQAALDSSTVSINEAFRASGRQLDNELDTMTADFTQALKGPIAYGSTPYVDQADILRHFGAQLTPRGDTFLIRAYGDSVDSTGDVEARAWCEAVVQRTPQYLDGRDDDHLRYSELVSEANRLFGRKFQIARFRWLNANEI